MKKTNLRRNFEIRFFERLVKDQPFYEALVCLANAYSASGFYEKGLEIDKKIISLNPDDMIANYNIACSYSLLNDIDNAIIYFKRAVLLGYDDIKGILSDPDLNNLRRDKRFSLFFNKMKKSSDFALK